MGTKKINSNDIIIDDGSKKFYIKNKNGDVLSEFTFRPADTNIVDRYKTVAKFFENFKIEEGTDPMEAEAKFIEQMDYLTNANTRDTFFSIMGAFSPMPDGRLYVDVCLEAIMNVINQELDARLEKSRQRISKYTAKYHA